MSIQGKAVLLVATVIGGAVTVDQYDKYAHYTPVQARVTNVQETCHLEKRSRRQREWTQDMPCERAEVSVKTAQFSGFHVERKIVVGYDYISPVDMKTHSGSHEYSAYPEGKPVARGQLLTIRASKTDPGKTRES